MTITSAADRTAEAAVAFALELALGTPSGEDEELGRLDRRAACAKLAQVSGWRRTVLEQAHDALDPGCDQAARDLLARTRIWAAWGGPG